MSFYSDLTETNQFHDKVILWKIVRLNSNWKRNRSSRPEMFCKKGVLKIFSKFTGKHPCHSLFFNIVAGQERLFIIEHLRWLLLKYFNLFPHIG